MIEDYFRQVDTLIASASMSTPQASPMTSAAHTSGSSEATSTFWMVLSCIFGSFNVQHGIERYMYAYHYQRSDGTMVFRYDNTPHFPTLSTFPHHKHEGSESNVVPAAQPDLQAILSEIRGLIAASAP